MGGRTLGRRRSHSARVKRRKLVIAATALVVVMGLAVFAATGGVLNLFTVQGTDIPDTDAH
jgi:Na+-driven multidrug efflux pump